MNPVFSGWRQWTGWAALQGQWLRHKHFTPAALARIAERISQSEVGHTGELMLAIEAVSARHEPDSYCRALEIFGRLQVWDTPQKSGVLLYLALDKRHIHIIADRGITAPPDTWKHVCHRLQEALRGHRYVEGVIAAVEEIESILAHYAPPLAEGAQDVNDLPNTPIFL